MAWRPTEGVRSGPLRKVAGLVVAVACILMGCSPAPEPELPASSDVVATADRVTGPDGPGFLESLTAASWDDDGHRAAEIFAWIPQTATSSDPVLATRAGHTAHAIAKFVAEQRNDIIGDPANPALWQALADSRVPYLGAMVGDGRGVEGFEPLDGLDSPMRRTATAFAAIAIRTEAIEVLNAAASKKAAEYEAAFAKSAMAEPVSGALGKARQDLLQAARLRGLIAAGRHVADPDSDKPTPAHAQTQLSYQVASLTARPGDPHLSPEYFIGERLRAPSEIPDTDWSVYDAQLTVYLASWPHVNDAIRQFGRTFSGIELGSNA